MDVNNRAVYFLQPRQPNHRWYEVLRSVFVEDESMQDVASRFEVSYGTVRNWVSEFCRCQDTSAEPPFFRKSNEDDHRSPQVAMT
jgi:transposase